MEKSEKTSTPVYKRCYSCKTRKPIGGFGADRAKWDGLQAMCRSCRSQYAKSESVKLAYRRYKQSPKGVMSRYRTEATAHRKKYKQKLNERWRMEHTNYYKERYYQIQDEAGCHSEVVSFYPGWRMIKALETAEVVTI